MNDSEKIKFVDKLKEKYPSVYKNMNIDDSLIIHRLRKNRGRE